jgi:hypothetical protein
MRKMSMRTLIPLLALAVVPLTLTGCNGGDVDDPDDSNAVMEVTQTTVSPATISGDISDGTCVLTVTNTTSTLANKAKSGPAEGAPFNDIVLQSLTIQYTWDDPAIVTPTRTFSLGGTIPAGGTASVQFPPIALGDTSSAMIGHSVNLFMIFRGVQVSGEPAVAQGGGVLSIGGSCDP